MNILYSSPDLEIVILNPIVLYCTSPVNWGENEGAGDNPDGPSF